MMRSLWSGVSGLQAHQTAMDVEGDNIANVNTTGFKYSRVSFASMLSQTSSIATAPQGDLGGTNPSQVGLGTQVSSTTTIFQQGSIESTDKTTDLAIQGSGFFIVSGDDGDSYKYTRDGDFNFDADGNFVDNNGYVIQGWLRDEDTLEVDSSSPIQSIQINSGLTTPASATSYISLQANLNSGSSIENKSSIYSLDAYNGGVDLDGDGTLAGIEISDENSTVTSLFDADDELYERGQDFGVLFDADGEALGLQDGEGVWVSYATASVAAVPITAGGYTVNFNLNNTNITGAVSGTAAENAIALAAFINAKSDDTGVKATIDNDELTLTNDNSDGNTDNQKNISIEAAAAPSTTNYAGFTAIDVITSFKYTYAENGAVPTTTVPTDARTFTTTEDLRYAMQNDAVNNVDYDLDGNNGTSDTDDNNAGVEVIVNSAGQFSISNDSGTHDMLMSVTGYQNATNSIYENTAFTDVIDGIQGNLSVGGSPRNTESIYVASKATSIDIYDSLGSKHTVRFEFTKQETSEDSGATWLMIASTDDPAELNGDLGSENIITGTVSFNSDGSLGNISPSSLSFTPNNGAEGSQTVDLEFGSSNGFDGLTSFDRESSVSGISRDGYTGGDLDGLEVDKTGTIIGTFTNGKSFGLAQVAMANFSNEVGLESDGGNTFVQTSNSGDPVIGVANAGGRGYIQSSALEMSNVDLSRSLTELIVIQRGYQANSKTITTSDEMLQTLLQLK